MKRRDRWIQILILGPTLVVLLWFGLSFLAARLIDCELGYAYSIRHGRCVGMLEFDLGWRAWW